MSLHSGHETIGFFSLCSELLESKIASEKQPHTMNSVFIIQSNCYKKMDSRKYLEY